MEWLQVRMTVSISVPGPRFLSVPSRKAVSSTIRTSNGRKSAAAFHRPRFSRLYLQRFLADSPIVLKAVTVFTQMLSLSTSDLSGLSQVGTSASVERNFRGSISIIMLPKIHD